MVGPDEDVDGRRDAHADAQPSSRSPLLDDVTITARQLLGAEAHTFFGNFARPVGRRPPGCARDTQEALRGPGGPTARVALKKAGEDLASALDVVTIRTTHRFLREPARAEAAGAGTGEGRVLAGGESRLARYVGNAGLGEVHPARLPEEVLDVLPDLVTDPFADRGSCLSSSCRARPRGGSERPVIMVLAATAITTGGRRPADPPFAKLGLLTMTAVRAAASRSLTRSPANGEPESVQAARRDEGRAGRKAGLLAAIRVWVACVLRTRRPPI